MSQEDKVPDPVRLIHAATDLQQAYAISIRLAGGELDPRTANVLEIALLADYSRPFIGLAEMSAPLALEGLGHDFSKNEMNLHSQLMALASKRASERRKNMGMPLFPVGEPLDGLPLEDVSALIVKLRRAVACCLYPGVADDPEKLQLLVGPLGAGSQ